MKILNGGCIIGILISIGGFPNAFWFGTEGKYNILVMDLLGENLETLLNFCKGKFTLKTALMIADQIVKFVQK